MPSTYSNLLYHIIFSTKQREPLITSALRGELYLYVAGILRGQDGLPLEIGGMPDHLHLVIRIRPDVSVSDIVRLIKANSSKWANERPNAPGRFAWQRGYGAFTVSVSQLESVRQYVRNQEEHHRTRTFQEEFVEFLKRHGIEFDERYLWE
jgi:REP element-mobilizing transposase RayT